MQISVIGAGTMGHGIAQASSMAGHEVTLRDIDESVLDEALAKIEENLNGAINHGKINKKTVRV